MPKAFTHLCHKINISLFEDKLTIYIKLTSRTAKGLRENKIRGKEFEEFCKSALIDMMPVRFVQRGASDHHSFHQDDFNIDTPHYHMHFMLGLNEAKLNVFLRRLVDQTTLLTSIERDSFISAYHLANELPKKASHIPAPLARKKVLASTEAKAEAGKVETKAQKITKGGAKRPGMKAPTTGQLLKRSGVFAAGKKARQTAPKPPGESSNSFGGFKAGFMGW